MQTRFHRISFIYYFWTGIAPLNVANLLLKIFAYHLIPTIILQFLLQITLSIQKVILYFGLVRNEIIFIFEEISLIKFVVDKFNNFQL